jgi:LysM repeat protein
MKTIFALLFCCFTVLAFAQSGNGTFHEVEAGETKYGISRTYGITIEQLEKFNPDIKEGLREGMKLYIPKPQQAAQETAAEKKDTAKFVYHEVKDGETMYSLSKDFGVGYAEMKALNPGLQDGLKVGQVLKLPKPVLLPQQPAKKDSSFVYHIVREGETAYSLSKQYRVSLDSLYLLNPEASGVLRLGQELRFKKRAGTSYPKTATESLNSDAPQTPKVPNEEEYFLYKVKSGDTFYSFKKKFEVTRAELLALNPELKEGLTVGRYIILPNNGKQEDAAWLDQLFSEVEGEGKEQEIKEGLKEDASPKKVDIDTLSIDYQKQFRVALLLPFFAPSISDTSFDYQVGFEKRSMVAMEFYQGFMLAVDSLNKAGMNITLEVMDTKNSRVAVDSKISELRLSKPDLIVGPLFKDHVERVADAFAADKVPVVSPLSNTVSVAGRPNLIKCINASDAFAMEVANILNRLGGKRNIIFAHTSAADELEKMKQIKARIKAINNEVSFDEVVGSKARDYVVGSAARAVLEPGKRNIYIALSDQEVFLADLVNQLYSARDTSIQLIASSKVMKVNALEYKYLNALHFTMPDGNFVDQEAEATKSFNHKFNEEYRIHPSRFAYQGYDVGMYFLSQLWQYGVYLPQSLGKPREGVSTGFSFAKEKNGGYENVFMFTTALRDYQLKRVH